MTPIVTSAILPVARLTGVKRLMCLKVTGGQIPDDKMGPNSSKLFISHGKHDDFIYQWNASERNDLFQWLAGLGFDL